MNTQSKNTDDSSSENNVSSLHLTIQEIEEIVPSFASAQTIMEASQSPSSKPSSNLDSAEGTQTSSEPSKQDDPLVIFSPSEVPRPPDSSPIEGNVFTQYSDNENDPYYGGDTETLHSKDSSSSTTPATPVANLTKNTIKYCKTRNLVAAQVVTPAPSKNSILCRPVGTPFAGTPWTNARPIDMNQSVLVTAEKNAASTRPRMVEINGVAVEVTTLDNGIEVSEHFDPILSNEDLKSPLFLYMKKRSLTNMNKPQRLKMLYDFIKRKHISVHFHQSLKDLDRMQALDYLLRQTYGGRNSQNMYALALKLYALYDLLKKVRSCLGSVQEEGHSSARIT